MADSEVSRLLRRASTTVVIDGMQPEPGDPPCERGSVTVINSFRKLSVHHGAAERLRRIDVQGRAERFPAAS